jgi:hypothetical protein
MDIINRDHSTLRDMGETVTVMLTARRLMIEQKAGRIGVIQVFGFIIYQLV